MGIRRGTSSQRQSSARDTYDRLSGWYDRLAGSEQPFVRLGLGMLNARPGESVLEIGPGTGQALLALACAVGPAGRVVGVDLSPGMLHRSTERVERAGLAGRVHLACADGACLPLSSGQFDALFLSFTLELFEAPEVPAVLAECRRVLRPGGRIGVVALSDLGDAGGMLKLYNWAQRHFPTWIDCRPIPAEQMLAQNGLCIVKKAGGRMWGLPVEVVLAIV